MEAADPSSATLPDLHAGEETRAIDPMARKKRITEVPAELTDTEKDLLSQMQNGYQLETDSLGSELVLRGFKDNQVMRPASANASTVKALERRGLITSAAKGNDPLTFAWRASNRNKGAKRTKRD